MFAAAGGRGKLKAQAAADAKAAGAEWAKSGATWFDTAQTVRENEREDPAHLPGGDHGPRGVQQNRSGTWYDTHAATLQSKVAAPLTTPIGKKVPAAQNKAVPTWYNTDAATLQSKITTPVSTWINTTVPGAQNKTVPHWYDTHPATLTSKVTTPLTTLIKTTVPEDWNGRDHQTGSRPWCPTHTTQVATPLSTFDKTTLPPAIVGGFTGAMTTVGGIANKDIASLNAVTQVGGISPIGSLHFNRGEVMPGYEPCGHHEHHGWRWKAFWCRSGRGLGGAKAINAINLEIRRIPWRWALR